MNHQSSFPTRQVHLISTAGVPVANGEGKGDLTFFCKAPLVYVPSSYDVILSCVSASIPYVWTNITSDNNTITIQYLNWQGNPYNGYTVSMPAISPTTYSLPIGNYSITSLINVLNEHVPNFTFSYIANVNLVSVTYVPGVAFVVTNAWHEQQYITPNGFTFIDTSLSDLLGFTNKISYNTDLPMIYRLTGTKPINLIKTTSVYVECPDLINESFDSRVGGQSGVICRIPVSGSPGNLLSWTNIFGTHSKIALKQINHIRVRLLDDARNVLDLRGFTWTVTLQFNVVEERPFIEGEWLQKPVAQ